MPSPPVEGDSATEAVPGVKGTNSANGPGVLGFSPSGLGVFAKLETGTALVAFSLTGAAVSASTGPILGGPPTADGVFGLGKNGVHGQSFSPTDNGVWGENSGDGDGVLGSSAGSGNGITGTSDKGNGVNGRSIQGFGVLGSSTGSNGVQGVSDASAGVRGTGANLGVQGDSDQSGFTLPSVNVGVWGDANAGIGVVGSSKTQFGVFGYSDGAQIAQRFPPRTFIGLSGECNSNKFGLFNLGFLSHVGVLGDGGVKGIGLYGRGGGQLSGGEQGLAGIPLQLEQVHEMFWT